MKAAATTIFVSRKQYDLFLAKCQAWVDLRWAEYSRAWRVSGVFVTGSIPAIENLKAQLAYVESK